MENKTIILDGKALAEKLKNQLKNQIQSFKKPPCLAVILVGNDSASQIYVANKEKAAKNIGINSFVYKLEENTSQEALHELIRELNLKPEVNGILLQLPLPKHLNADKAIMTISPSKDVDGLHFLNLGALTAGENRFIPCTPFGIMSLLKEYNIEIQSKRVVVIGRSRLVGKPIAQLLINHNATVSIVHSKTSENDFKELLKISDIVICAIGKAKYIKGSLIKQGSCIIDVGINKLENNKICGDVDYESCLGIAGAITPVPGGIGPLTVAHLLINTVQAYNNSYYES